MALQAQQLQQQQQQQWVHSHQPNAPIIPYPPPAHHRPATTTTATATAGGTRDHNQALATAAIEPGTALGREPAPANAVSEGGGFRVLVTGADESNTVSSTAAVEDTRRLFGSNTALAPSVFS
jgi:hypothetical protein